MNDTDKYILDAIRTWVWSGFYSPAEVEQLIDDILEPGADEAMLRAAVAPEFAKKAAAEASWPGRTDCDRLDAAFAELNAAGIIALHNAGYTMSDGHEDVGKELHQRGRPGIRGYCFYHAQDLERAVAGDGLMLAFGDLDAEDDQKVVIGREVQQALERAGLSVEWNGKPNTRIGLPRLDWKRRRRDADEGAG
jgi:class 3 adenylate cyclase